MLRISLILFILQSSIALIQAQTTTTIHEIQMVDINGGSDASSFVGQLVTVQGVVTASGEPNNLSSVFIQEEGLTEWAGIQLKSGSGLGSVGVGDLIEVTGTVLENFGMTVIEFITEIVTVDSGQIEPLPLDPNIFTTYDLATNEKYEGMLIELTNTDGPITVVDANPDLPNNFGEWRVGSDPKQTDAGCRILTGRQTSSISSSLNVSWVNDKAWASNSGSMNVTPIVVSDSDAFEAIRGLMSYSSGNFKLLPRNNDDVLLKTSSARNHHQIPLTFAVYPNPAVHHASLSFDLETSANLSVVIYDLRGRTVAFPIRDQHFQNGHHAIPLANLPAPGLYLVTLESAVGRTATKLLIE